MERIRSFDKRVTEAILDLDAKIRYNGSLNDLRLKILIGLYFMTAVSTSITLGVNAKSDTVFFLSLGASLYFGLAILWVWVALSWTIEDIYVIIDQKNALKPDKLYRNGNHAWAAVLIACVLIMLLIHYWDAPIRPMFLAGIAIVLHTTYIVFVMRGKNSTPRKKKKKRRKVLTNPLEKLQGMLSPQPAYQPVSRGFMLRLFFVKIKSFAPQSCVV